MNLARCFAAVSAGLVVIANAPLAYSQQAAHAEAQLELADAVKFALAKNERAKIADYQLDVADAAVERARTAFFPTLTANGADTLKPDEPTRAGGTAAPNNIANFTTTLSQPILNASAWPLYRQAQRLFDAQKANSEDAKRVLAFDAANAFFVVLSQEESLEAAQHRLDSAKANLNDTQARVEAQLSSSNDATRAAVDLASAQQDVDSVKGSVNRAYLALSFVIDQPVQGPLAPPTGTLQAAQTTVANVDQLVAVGETKRLDLIAAKHNVRAAELFASEP
ncbi:MAG TPA: TolC family protein, partial [Polyangiaceae bacterium]